MYILFNLWIKTSIVTIRSIQRETVEPQHFHTMYYAVYYALAVVYMLLNLQMKSSGVTIEMEAVEPQHVL